MFQLHSCSTLLANVGIVEGEQFGLPGRDPSLQAHATTMSLLLPHAIAGRDGDNLGTLTHSKKTCYAMWACGSEIHEIASDRGIKSSTLVGYLTDAVEAGYEYDLDRFGIPANVEAHVGLVMSNLGSGNITAEQISVRDIRDHLPPCVLAEWWMVKLLLSHSRRIRDLAGDSTV